MAGDSLVEVKGPYHRCTSCGASWTDKELVIVNDEPFVDEDPFAKGKETVEFVERYVAALTQPEPIVP